MNFKTDQISYSRVLLRASTYAIEILKGKGLYSVCLNTIVH